MIIIGIIVGIIISLAITALLLSASFFLPQNTVLFATATPRALRTALQTEQIRALPASWQHVIVKGSRWPIIFGLAQNEGKTNAFVIGPRWAVPRQVGVVDQSQFLVRQSGLIDRPSTDSVVYRFSAFNYLLHSGEIQGWVNPSLIFSKALASSSPIFFQYKDSQLHIADAASSSTTANTEPALSAVLKNADLSLQNSPSDSLITSEDLLSILPLEMLGVTLHSLQAAPNTIQVRMTSTTLDALELGFQYPLTLKEYSTITSQLTGQGRDRRLLGLPDGTLAVERITEELSISTSTDLRVISWHAPNPSELSPVLPCADGRWIARVSPRLLQSILPNEFASYIPSTQNALQVHRIKDELIICREK